jgi:hypothetical protein
MRHETGFRVDAVALVRLSGLASGTRVLTPEGEVAVEALRRGDRVMTRGGPLRMIVAEARAARVAPVRIAAQALGLRMPGRDLVLGPATRVWLPRQSKPLEALRLVDGQFVTEEAARVTVLWTLVFAGPQVVRADGVEVCV